MKGGTLESKHLVALEIKNRAEEMGERKLLGALGEERRGLFELQEKLKQSQQALLQRGANTLSETIGQEKNTHARGLARLVRYGASCYLLGAKTENLIATVEQRLAALAQSIETAVKVVSNCKKREAILEEKLHILQMFGRAVINARDEAELEELQATRQP